MKKLHICLSTDDNYAKYAATVILSILKNKHDDEEHVFHILYSSLCDENINKLKSVGNVVFHLIDNSIFEPYFNSGVCKNITIPTLYRLKLPSLLPGVQRILYLDCDLVVLNSLSELYFTEFAQNEYLAAVPDLGFNLHMDRMGFENKGHNFYFNAGVCLLDLEKMRHDNIEQKMFEYLKQNWQNISYSDQDVMNAVLLGNVKKLDRKYNFITPNFYFLNNSHQTIVHFAGVKPWKIGFYNPYRDIFWQYYMQTPFADDKKQISIMNNAKFMHKKIMQILLYLKMYPLFFFSKVRLHDFMRIIKNIEFNN